MQQLDPNPPVAWAACASFEEIAAHGRPIILGNQSDSRGKFSFGDPVLKS